MDIETLFTSSKWDIIELLAKKSYSPLELSKKLNTTMANVSQQLRLLEALKFVNKKKISNRDKGKPRTLYSLSGDYTYVIAFMPGFAQKKLIKLDSHNKNTIKNLLSKN